MKWASPEVRDLALRCSIMTITDCWKVLHAYSGLVVDARGWRERTEADHKAVFEFIHTEDPRRTDTRLRGSFQVGRAAYITAKAMEFEDGFAAIISKMAAEEAAIRQFKAQGLDLPTLSAIWPLDDDIEGLDDEANPVIDDIPGSGFIPKGILESFGDQNNVGKQGGDEPRRYDDDISRESEGFA